MDFCVGVVCLSGLPFCAPSSSRKTENMHLIRGSGWPVGLNVSVNGFVCLHVSDVHPGSKPRLSVSRENPISCSVSFVSEDLGQCRYDSFYTSHICNTSSINQSYMLNTTVNGSCTCGVWSLGGAVVAATL